MREKVGLIFFLIMAFNTTVVMATFLDTNWQTSWVVFDANFKTQYQLNTENILHTHDTTYYTQAQCDANWNKYILINADINFSQLQNYPPACPAGQAIQDINDTNYTCITVGGGGTDTNWQTSFTTFDANLKATYPIKTDVNNWGTQNYVSYTNGITMPSVSGNSGKYLTTNGTTLSWDTNFTTVVFSTGTGQTHSTTGVDVNGLGLSMVANKDYGFACYIVADGQAASTGVQIAMNGPASPTDVSFTTIVWTSTTVFTTTGVTAYETYSTNSTSHGNGFYTYKMFGVIRNGANAGTLIPRIRSDKAAQWVEAKKGSYCIYTPAAN